MAALALAFVLFLCMLQTCKSFNIENKLLESNVPSLQRHGPRADPMTDYEGPEQVRPSLRNPFTYSSSITLEPVPSNEEVVSFTHMGKLTVDVAASVVHVSVDIVPLIDNASSLDFHLAQFLNRILELRSRYQVSADRLKKTELDLILNRMSRNLELHQELLEETILLGRAQGVKISRHKRAAAKVLMAAASVISGLIGSVMMANSINEQGELIEHIIDEQEELSRSIESMEPGIESTLASFNHTLDTLNSYADARNQYPYAQSAFYYDQSAHAHEYFHGLLLYCQIMESHLNEYTTHANTYLRALLRTFQGEVDPLIFPPSEVKLALEQLDQTKPDNLRLMFSASHRDLNGFFRLKSTLVKTTQLNKYRIGVLIPLLNQKETFELFKFSSGPISMPDRPLEFLFQTDEEFFLVDRGRSYHHTMGTTELLACTKYGTNHYVCPKIRILQKTPSCLSVLFKSETSQIHKYCEFSVRTKKTSSLVQTGSQFLLTSQEPLSLYSECIHQDPLGTTSPVGQVLINLPSGCSLDAQTHMITTSSNNTYESSNARNLLIRLGTTTIFSLLSHKYPALELETEDGLSWIEHKIQRSGLPTSLQVLEATRGKINADVYVRSPVTTAWLFEALAWVVVLALLFWLVYKRWWDGILHNLTALGGMIRSLNPFPPPAPTTTSWVQEGQANEPEDHQAESTMSGLTSPGSEKTGSIVGPPLRRSSPLSAPRGLSLSAVLERNLEREPRLGEGRLNKTT